MFVYKSTYPAVHVAWWTQAGAQHRMGGQAQHRMVGQGTEETVTVCTHLILVEEDLQLPHADTKVSLVELIRDVPSQGAKLPPLLHKSMKEAQTEQEVPPLFLQMEASEGGREGGGKGGECYVHHVVHT